MLLRAGLCCNNGQCVLYIHAPYTLNDVFFHRGTDLQAHRLPRTKLQQMRTRSCIWSMGKTTGKGVSPILPSRSSGPLRPHGSRGDLLHPPQRAAAQRAGPNGLPGGPRRSNAGLTGTFPAPSPSSHDDPLTPPRPHTPPGHPAPGPSNRCGDRAASPTTV